MDEFCNELTLPESVEDTEGDDTLWPVVDIYAHLDPSLEVIWPESEEDSTQ